MEVKVKKIKKEGTLSDKGFVTDVYVLTMIGSSSDGELEASLVLKSKDSARIEDMVKMVHGTKMILKLKDMNHTLDKFDIPERPSMSPAEADAYNARLEAAKAKD